MEDIWNKIKRVRNNITIFTFQSYFLTLSIYYTYVHMSWYYDICICICIVFVFDWLFSYTIKIVNFLVHLEKFATNYNNIIK